MVTSTKASPTHRKPSRRASLLAAATLLGLSAAPALADGTGGPARVTGLSVVLDIAQTGASVGLPIAYGTGTSIFFTAVSVGALPAALHPFAGEEVVLLNVSDSAFEKLETGSLTGIQLLREAIAPLSAGNAVANTAVTGLTGAIDTFVKAEHTAIQPFDVTVLQFDALVRSTEAPPS